MNILILGDGSAGRRHARMLRMKGHNVAVMGPLQASPAFHPTDVEACVIATPPDTHAMYLAWYCDKMPVLCEGPVTVQVPTQGHAHMVASNWLFVPQVQALKKRLLTGDARPVQAHLYFNYDLRRWRSDIDYRTTCYFTSGIDYINCHEATTACWLFGPPSKVHTERVHTGLSLGTDAVSVLCRHANGMLTTINSGWHSATYKRGIVVYFDDGSVEELQWNAPLDNSICNDSYDEMLEHWLGAIAGRHKVIPTMQLGYNGYKMMRGECV